MQKISTLPRSGSRIFKGRQQTIGLDLRDRWSWYMKQVFGRMPRSRIALETGAYSPWVSRLLTALGHEVIVAHARNVRLIGESRRKDDRIDARTLARLARVDPQLLSRVQNRSDQASSSTSG